MRQESQVYFWLDTWCDDCQIDDNSPRGKYLVCNDTILAADFADAREIAESFKSLLKKTYAHSDDLTNSVVFRYKNSRRDAIKQKRLQMDKMKGRGYVIYEIAFKPDQ